MNNHPQAINYLQNTSRYLLYTLLVFTPLARGSVQGWAITTIHLITILSLTAFLIEKTLTGKWQWIKTPLDKPFLCLLSTALSLHRQTSFWSIILLLNYLTNSLFNHLTNTDHLSCARSASTSRIICARTFPKIDGVHSAFCQENA